MEPKPLNLIDIVLSIYNQEKIITRIINGIFRSTTTPFNLILVFDGCIDQSQKKCLTYINKIKPMLLRDLRITITPDVNETRANNAGLRLSTADYVIMIQDDMEIREQGWERRLTFPLRVLPDTFAVGSRAGFDIVSMSPEKQVYAKRAGREFLNLGRNIFAVRDYINRGPIAFNRQRLAELGFLDDHFAPCNLDDAELCLCAWRDHRWRAGVYWIDYYSPIKWSKGKQTPLFIRKEPASRAKNAGIIAHDHAAYLQSGKKHSEDTKLPWCDVDYQIGTSRRKIMFRLWFSQLRFIINLLSGEIKRGIYRLKVSCFSPLSPYRLSAKTIPAGESSEQTRRRTEFH